MTRLHTSVNCITPPHMLKKLLESGNKAVRDAALNTLLATARLRGERTVRAAAGFLATPAQGRRTVYDCRNSVFLPGALVARTEDGQASSDASVNHAFDGLGATREFYKEVFNRNSIDGRGMRLDGYVHRGVSYNNAFWDGQEMVFGDGDGIIFADFTRSLDVIAHELAHGVTEFTANLEYRMQSGALNESMSDVFGTLVKQWALNQTAEEADWLIGADIFTPDIGADALRSMKSPGEAYDNDLLGKDPQPAHMDKFVQLPDTEDGDWGGVHINSGIPNKAFVAFALGVGGRAWEAPGTVWYESLRASHSTTEFQAFADTTYAKAGELFDSQLQTLVVEAWREVGIRVSRTSTARRILERGDLRAAMDGAHAAVSGEDRFVILTKQLQEMAGQVKSLTKELKAIKSARYDAANKV